MINREILEWQDDLIVTLGLSYRFKEHTHTHKGSDEETRDDWIMMTG